MTAQIVPHDRFKFRRALKDATAIGTFKPLPKRLLDTMRAVFADDKKAHDLLATRQAGRLCEWMTETVSETDLDTVIELLRSQLWVAENLKAKQQEQQS